MKDNQHFFIHLSAGRPTLMYYLLL